MPLKNRRLDLNFSPNHFLKKIVNSLLLKQNTEKIIKNKQTERKTDKREGVRGKKRWSGRGEREGLCCLISRKWGGGGWKSLDADSGQWFNPPEWLTLLPLHYGPKEGWLEIGGACREACSCLCICILWPWVVVLIMWQLGRLIVDKQQDYEGLCGSKGSTGWERPVICEAERKLVRAGWSCLLPAYLRKWKSCAKRILK